MVQPVLPAPLVRKALLEQRVRKAGPLRLRALPAPRELPVLPETKAPSARPARKVARSAGRKCARANRKPHAGGVASLAS